MKLKSFLKETKIIKKGEEENKPKQAKQNNINIVEHDGIEIFRDKNTKKRKDVRLIIEGLLGLFELISFDNELEMNNVIVMEEIDKADVDLEDLKHIYMNMLCFYMEFLNDEFSSKGVSITSKNLKKINLVWDSKKNKVEINLWKLETLIDALDYFIDEKEESILFNLIKEMENLISFDDDNFDDEIIIQEFKKNDFSIECCKNLSEAGKVFYMTSLLNVEYQKEEEFKKINLVWEYKKNKVEINLWKLETLIDALDYFIVIKKEQKKYEILIDISELISIDNDEDLNYEIAKREFDENDIELEYWKQILEAWSCSFTNSTKNISKENINDKNKFKMIVLLLQCEGYEFEINLWKFEILIDSLCDFIKSKE